MRKHPLLCHYATTKRAVSSLASTQTRRLLIGKQLAKSSTPSFSEHSWDQVFYGAAPAHRTFSSLHRRFLLLPRAAEDEGTARRRSATATAINSVELVAIPGVVDDVGPQVRNMCSLSSSPCLLLSP